MNSYCFCVVWIKVNIEINLATQKLEQKEVNEFGIK